VTVALRRAGPDDVAALVALAREPGTAGVLATGSDERLATAFDRADETLLVIDADGGFAGGLRLVRHNRRSRIGGIHTLLVDPAVRGRGMAVAALRALAAQELADDRLHRLEAEVYGFNAPALRTFAAAGFTREGVRRRAYDRHGTWQDGILFGLLAEDLTRR